jgi:hypothetical protein
MESPELGADQRNNPENVALSTTEAIAIISIEYRHAWEGLNWSELPMLGEHPRYRAQHRCSDIATGRHKPRCGLAIGRPSL